jgi:hypothetical protein
MNKYLRTNVSKPNPPLGRLIEGHLKENSPASAPALARNIPPYENANTSKRNSHNTSGPNSKRPRPNNKTGGRRKTYRHSCKY